MLPEWIAGLPPWLIAGLVLGVMASTLVAVLFVVVGRLYPADAARTAAPDGGTARRRTEIREYLAVIDERYIEDYTLNDYRVAFYLPDREVAITFDAQTYFALEDEGVYPVLCEHEMPGSQLGRRLPFDIPEIPADSTSGENPVETAFDRLNLAPTTDEQAIRGAYRERVKEVHPDQGGDRESFEAVQAAYATALAHAETGDKRLA